MKFGKVRTFHTMEMQIPLGSSPPGCVYLILLPETQTTSNITIAFNEQPVPTFQALKRELRTCSRMPGPDLAQELRESRLVPSSAPEQLAAVMSLRRPSVGLPDILPQSSTHHVSAICVS